MFTAEAAKRAPATPAAPAGAGGEPEGHTLKAESVSIYLSWVSHVFFTALFVMCRCSFDSVQTTEQAHAYRRCSPFVFCVRWHARKAAKRAPAGAADEHEEDVLLKARCVHSCPLSRCTVCVAVVPPSSAPGCPAGAGARGRQVGRRGR